MVELGGDGDFAKKPIWPEPLVEARVEDLDGHVETVGHPANIGERARHQRANHHGRFGESIPRAGRYPAGKVPDHLSKPLRLPSLPAADRRLTPPSERR